MSEPRTDRDISIPSFPANVTQPGYFFDQARGVSYVVNPQNAGREIATDIRNFRINDVMKYQCRYSYTAIGATTSSTLYGAVSYVRNDGVQLLYRFRQSGVDYYDGTNWTALTGTGANVPAGFRVSTVPWGNSLLFTDGATGIFAIDPSAHSYALISGSPICKYLTTFGNRVIASHVIGSPQRIQWSVNRDSTDWAGTGSGNEDLTSSPGGSADIQYEVYPLNDSEAIVHRSSSMWLMTLTGDPDAPFSFSFLHRLNSDSPRAAAVTPQGLAVFARDNVYMVTTSGIKAIGDQVKPAIYDVDSVWNANLGIVDAAYYPGPDEFVIWMPSLSLIYCYKLKFDAWTVFDPVPSPLVSGFVRVPFKGPAYLATGMIYYSQSDSGAYSVRYEDEATSTAIAAYVVTGNVLPDDPSSMARLETVRADLSGGMQSTITYTITAMGNELSTDNTTLASSTIARGALTRTIAAASQKQVTKPQLQIKFALSTSPGVVLNRIIVRTMPDVARR